MSLAEALGAFLTGLLTGLFNFVMTLVITVIQVVTWPLNQLITANFPDLSQKITDVADLMGQLIGYIPYLLTWFPPGIPVLLLFMVGVEITLLYIFQSSYTVAKVWKIVQHIKFW